MLAFAIGDGAAGRPWGAGARLGVKPLYWAIAGDRLLFASEIKAILKSGLVAATPNVRVLSEVLATRGTAGEETMFEGVYKLLPGHRLVFQGGRGRIEKYWDLSLDRPHPELERMHDGALIDRFRSLLHGSVRLRRIADVALGTVL